MMLDNIQIKKKYFVKTNSGESFRVMVRGISRNNNVKCTEILDGSHFVCKPEELYEEVDYKDLDALLNKAENKINYLRRELKGNYAELLDKYNHILKSEMKLFANAMVLPTFNDSWKDKFFEIIKEEGIPVSKEYLADVVFNPDSELYDGYMSYDDYGIDDLLNAIFGYRDAFDNTHGWYEKGDMYEKLNQLIESEYHRLNPELSNKPYDLIDLINEGYIDVADNTLYEELFSKIEKEDFKNFVLSIAE